MKENKDEIIGNVIVKEEVSLSPEMIIIKEEMMEEDFYETGEPVADRLEDLEDTESDESLEPGEIPSEKYLELKIKKEIAEIVGKGSQVERLSLKECYVDVHKGVDKNEIARCKRCRKMGVVKFSNSSVSDSDSESLPKSEEDCEMLDEEGNTNTNTTDSGGENSYSEDEIFYKCEYCSKKYIHRGSFKEHQRRRHGKYQTLTPLASESSSSQQFPSSAEPQRFKCFLCQSEFNDPAIYLSHLESHESKPVAGVYKLKCEICGHRYKNKKNLQLHLRQHEDSGKTFKCTECDEIFLEERLMKSHMGKIHRLKVFECDACPYKTNTVAALVQHKNKPRVHDLGAKRIKCWTCNRTFHDTQSFKKHKEEHHFESYECDICHKTCKTKSNMETHIAKHFVNWKKCEFCTKLFRRKENYVFHLARRDLNFEYKCEYCCESFETEGALLYHRNVVHKIPKVRCEECRMAFHTPERLEAHVVRIHRKGECSLCQKTFKKASYYKRHMNAVHSSQHYGCDKCGKSYMTKSYLNAHLKRCLQEFESFEKCIWQPVKNDDQVRYVRCRTCKMTFKNLDSLRRHNIDCHVGQDGHHCHNCTKLFLTKQHLNIHLKRCLQKIDNDVARKRFLCCKKCDEIYLTKAEYDEHLRQHNADQELDLGDDCEIVKDSKDDEDICILDIKPSEKVKKFACSECGKKFETAQDLAKHSVIGHFITERDCDDCGERECASASNSRDSLNVGNVAALLPSPSSDSQDSLNLNFEKLTETTRLIARSDSRDSLSLDLGKLEETENQMDMLMDMPVECVLKAEPSDDDDDDDVMVIS